VPGQEVTQICQSECCECEKSEHGAYTNNEGQRRFKIKGSIDIEEREKEVESGRGKGHSQGKWHKNDRCVLNNNNGLGSGAEECVEASTC
jgi:hypothetical protein